jgi:ABC-type multidrug transport system fused ATPase/permease subunit
MTDQATHGGFASRLASALELLPVGFRMRFGLSLLVKIFLGLLDLALAWILYQLFLVLQGVTASRLLWLPHTLDGLAALCLIILAARLAGEIFVNHWSGLITQRLHAYLLTKLSGGYLRLKWTSYTQRNRSELVRHCLTTSLDAAYAYQMMVDLAAASTIVAVLSFVAFWKGRLFALSLSGLIVALVLLHRLVISKALDRGAARRERALRSLQVCVGELFHAAREIRTYRNLDFFANRLAADAIHLGTANVRIATLPQIARGFIEHGLVMVLILFLLVSQHRGAGSQALIPVLVFYFILARRILPSVSQVFLLLGQMDGAFYNVQLIQQELRQNATDESRPLAACMPPPGLALEISDLDFHYPGGLPVLKEINLSLRRGEIAVLRGLSGRGKSTLLNMIAGVLQPCGGSIAVDAATMAYVPQEITLLDDTVRANILFGLADHGETALWQALQMAQLKEFVAALPLGLDTRVGDNGILFSGGQRQRLGLARALVRKPRLLLLDEATSALDRETEERVLRNITSDRNTAVLLVAHRPDLGELATTQLYLDEASLMSLRENLLVPD